MQCGKNGRDKERGEKVKTMKTERSFEPEKVQGRDSSRVISTLLGNTPHSKIYGYEASNSPSTTSKTNNMAPLPAAAPPREWTPAMQSDLARILSVGEECISEKELRGLILAKGRGTERFDDDGGVDVGE